MFPSVCCCCPATAEDLVGPSWEEAIFGDVCGIRIEGGIHNHHEDFVLPVSVEVVAYQYGPFSCEYDMCVEVAGAA
jgi:hypothetical protein